MTGNRFLIFLLLCLLLLGCGKSSKLAPLLPDAPEGWKIEGIATNRDVSGIGHSSTRSYAPLDSAAGMGVARVKVQILIADKGADQKKVQEMSLETKYEFKAQTEFGGLPAFETLALPDNDHHSLDLLPRRGAYVQVVAYKGGPGWDNGQNRHAVVAAFAGKVDLRKVAAVE